jgi:hypothetical protein
MKVPELFYGNARQVSTKVRAFAKQIAKADRYSNFDYGPLLDTQDVPGIILVNKEFAPSPQPNFHCYLLSEFLVDAVGHEKVHGAMELWLKSSLEDLSKFLCTLGGLSWLGLQDAEPAACRRYIEAAVVHWEAVKHERGRFGPLVSSEETLLHIWITLFFAAERLGLPTQERVRHLGAPPAVLLELSDRFGRHGMPDE